MSQFSVLKSLVLSFLVSIAIISCGGGGGGADSTDTTGGTTGTTSSFKGTYSGSFSGTEMGTWTLDIDVNGKVTGTAVITSQQGATISLAGTISVTGNSTVTGIASGISFTITIDTNGNVTGTWADSQNAASKGTITGKLGNGGVATTNGTLELVGADFGKTSLALTTGSVLFPNFESIFTYVGTNDTYVSSVLIRVDVSRKVTEFGLSITPLLDLKNSNCYSILCTGPAPDASCSNVIVDATKKTITFTNAVIFSEPVSQECKSVDPVTVNGTLNFELFNAK